ncbi:MAG TPA: hypothetical protein VGH27_11235 [Streptosporangiaceae bacterium]
MIFLGEGADDVSLRLLHPSRCFGVTHEVEKPSKQRQAVPGPEPEAGSVWREGVGERTRVFINGPDSVSYDMGYRLGVLLVIKKVRDDPGWSGDWNAVHGAPLARTEGSLVQPDVGTTRLPPVPEREIMPLRGQMTEAIERCGRAVGYDPLFRRPLPSRNLRGELEPSRPKVEVIRRRRACQAIHAVSYPFQDTVGSQPLESSRRDPGQLSLTAGHQAPLVLGER